MNRRLAHQPERADDTDDAVPGPGATAQPPEKTEVAQLAERPPAFARLTRFQGIPERIEEGIFLLHERVIPRARQRAGYVHGYWLVDRKTGIGAVLSLWESEAALRDSEEAASLLREAVTDEIGGTVLGVDYFEVVGRV